MANLALLGKTVLIGDGAKKLGGLISRAFAADGARVCIHYNSDSEHEDALNAVAGIRESGGDAFAVQGDLTQAKDVTRIFESVRKRFSGIDIAINLVGNVRTSYDSLSSVSAKAAYFFIQEAGKQLNDNGKICTIVTSTNIGLKAPIEQFTDAASREFGPRGISVTAIGQGPTDVSTPLFFGQESVLEDIVPLVQFLVTDGWWINGQTILANGSYVTH